MKTEKDVMEKKTLEVLKDTYSKLDDLRLACGTLETKQDKLWYIRNEVRNAIRSLKKEIM